VDVLQDVEHPIVLAPLAGGPSTPELTVAVMEAGAFGFLAAGYLSPEAFSDRLSSLRSMTGRPFGVNLFVPGRPSDTQVVADYAALLEVEAGRAHTQLGDPRFHDDHWDEKIELLLAEPVAVVSFTFGCPSTELIGRFHDRGTDVWITVTNAHEGAAAEAAGADVLVAQGSEAGGHRGTWRDDDPDITGIGVLALVQILRSNSAISVVATGGIATGGGIAAVLNAGASAAALGTAFLRCPEAGTSEVHREALAGSAPTALTRAFTGRMARGIRNRMIDQYTSAAPSAYPEVHYLTAPLRQAGREAGDPDVVNLWAGQAYELADDIPAAELVDRLAFELDIDR
jgi:nitronate monooxygenase